jgi:hypothetical protein
LLIASREISAQIPAVQELDAAVLLDSFSSKRKKKREKILLLWHSSIIIKQFKIHDFEVGGSMGKESSFFHCKKKKYFCFNSRKANISWTKRRILSFGNKIMIIIREKEIKKHN